MLADEVRAAAASRLPAWTVAPDGRSLSRTHQTASFVAGLDWFNAIMPIAEAEGHHPDLSLVDWNRAEVRLSTHVRRSAPPLPLSLLCVCEKLPLDRHVAGYLRTFAVGALMPLSVCIFLTSFVHLALFPHILFG